MIGNGLAHAVERQHLVGQRCSGAAAGAIGLAEAGAAFPKSFFGWAEEFAKTGLFPCFEFLGRSWSRGGSYAASWRTRELALLGLLNVGQNVFLGDTATLACAVNERHIDVVLGGDARDDRRDARARSVAARRFWLPLPGRERARQRG